MWAQLAIYTKQQHGNEHLSRMKESLIPGGVTILTQGAVLAIIQIILCLTVKLYISKFYIVKPSKSLFHTFCVYTMDLA